MTSLRFVERLRDLVDGVDVVLSDIWGVVHNGLEAFPEACEALHTYRERGGTVILITNAPRPADSVQRQLRKLGVADETCVSCCNATAGLTASLLATGRTGNVVLPAFTFAASLGAVRAAGMTPLILDVDPQSWALGAASLERALAATGAGVVMLLAPFSKPVSPR